MKSILVFFGGGGWIRPQSFACDFKAPPLSPTPFFLCLWSTVAAKMVTNGSLLLFLFSRLHARALTQHLLACRGDQETGCSVPEALTIQTERLIGRKLEFITPTLAFLFHSWF